jgi:hypothetical protein
MIALLVEQGETGAIEDDRISDEPLLNYSFNALIKKSNKMQAFRFVK